MSAEASYDEAQSTNSDQLKVMIVVGDFPPIPGGMSDQTESLARELVNIGVRVKVLTTKVAGEEAQSIRFGARIRRVMIAWRLSEIGSILREIDELGPDTIVSVMYGDSTTRRRPLVNLLPVFLRLLRPHCRLIVNIQEFRTQRTLWRAWAAPMIMTAHGVIFVDPPDRESLLQWTKLKRPRMECIPITPNILPVPVTAESRRAWRQRLGIAEDTPIVTFFGSFIRSKGLPDLLEAMNNLRRDAIPGCLLLMGFFPHGYTGAREFETRMRRLLSDGLSAGWIKLAENCPPDVVSEYLHASDVVVLPFVRGARYNNTTVLAALVHGAAVITTQGVDTPEGFAEQFGVALVPAGDPAALTKRLKEILLSDAEKTRLRSMAALAGKDFSWGALARKTEAFFCSFKAQRPRQNLHEY